MKVRFSQHPDDHRPAWAGGGEACEWGVPDVVRIVFDGVRTGSGERPVVGIHPNDELYIPVTWSRETVVLVAVGEGAEVIIQARKES